MIFFFFFLTHLLTIYVLPSPFPLLPQRSNEYSTLIHRERPSSSAKIPPPPPLVHRRRPVATLRQVEVEEYLEDEMVVCSTTGDLVEEIVEMEIEEEYDDASNR